MPSIVYVSNTGHTKRYAELLSRLTGFPAFPAKQAKRELLKNEEIIYFGWLFAGSIKGYSAAARRHNIIAVCGVGLGDTGSQLDTVRKTAKIPAELPLFTLQGGMDHQKLKGIYKFMISMLTKAISSKQQRTDDEEKMLQLLVDGGDFVDRAHLQDVIAWIEEHHI
ncbi:MAG: hypothetical protein IJW40_08145 [Clostridia bacterium]|nr:hypothetical protein [Clostridia bacterium]